MKFLDSDFLIDFLRGERAAAEFLEKSGEQKFATTSINAFEVLYGAKMSSRREAGLASARKLLDRLEIFRFDSAAAEVASEANAEMMKRGSGINIEDVFIAGIVLANDGEMVTRNLKDFSRIRGLRVSSW